MASVTFRDIRKSFGKVEVLHGIGFDINDGEFVVLVGPSGCGKSTLLRMLAGLEEITGGEIVIDGRVVNDLESKDRDIAMVFQSYALYPHMTVRENMGFSLRLRNADKATTDERVMRAAKILNLDQLLAALSARAVGRPAPARGDGPRDRARPQGVPVRRAAVQPRCQAAGGDARRDQGAAPALEDDHGLRHARPDRGDDDGRSHRRDARRHRRADRHAAGAVRPAGQPVRRAVHRLAGDERAARHAAPRRQRCARRGARRALAGAHQRGRHRRPSGELWHPAGRLEPRAATASPPRCSSSSRPAPRPSCCCRWATRSSRW